MRQLASEHRARGRLGLDYLLYAPSEPPAGARAPLVVFLHGIGERGHDLSLVKRHGLPRLLEQGARFPFWLLAPQCPPDKRWTELLDALDRVLDEVLKAQPVDPERVYLTGLSLGGEGAWWWASERPERFAALAVVCGRSRPEAADRLSTLPIWVFHGEQDAVVPFEESTRMVSALETCGVKPQFTRYAELAHNAWDAAYGERALYAWLLAQRRSKE